MQHSFDVDIAKEYGILEAILLNHLWFWIKKNEANDTNHYDDNYWTYNSTRAFNELFPYVSQRQIQNALTRLKNEEIIITGNYNNSAYDRTLWYAFSKKGKCIMQKCKMEDVKKGNGLVENVKPIPDNNTNINKYNTDIKEKNIKKEKYGKYGRVKLTKEEYKRLTEEFGENFIKEQIELLDEYVETNNNKNKYTNFNLVLRKSIRENWFRKRNEAIPNWFDKKVKEEELTKDEEKVFDELLNNII